MGAQDDMKPLWEDVGGCKSSGRYGISVGEYGSSIRFRTSVGEYGSLRGDGTSVGGYGKLRTIWKLCGRIWEDMGAQDDMVYLWEDRRPQLATRDLP